MVYSQKGISTIVVIIIVGLILAAGITGFALFSNSNNQTPMPANNSALPTDTSENSDPMMETAKTIEITGNDFSFSPSNITMKKGETIKIVLHAVDMPHDFVIDDLNVKSDTANPGEAVEVEFTANETGEFEYYCSVGNHRAQGMVGTLIVTQ